MGGTQNHPFQQGLSTTNHLIPGTPYSHFMKPPFHHHSSIPCHDRSMPCTERGLAVGPSATCEDALFWEKKMSVSENGVHPNLIYGYK